MMYNHLIMQLYVWYCSPITSLKTKDNGGYVWGAHASRRVSLWIN